MAALLIDHRDIRQRLRSHLLTLGGLPAANRRAWENREFKPPNPPALWIRENLIPIDEAQVGNDTTQLVAYWQVDVLMPKGEGTEAGEDLAVNIKNHFKPITSLVSGGGRGISVYKSEKLSGRDDGDSPWWFYPVQVTFRAYGHLNT